MTPLPSRLRLLLLTLGFALLSSGCVRRVTVRTDPPGANVTRRGEPVGATPVELRVWWIPFVAQEVRVGLPGYRPATVAVGRHLGWFRQETVHDVIMIPRHGRSGSWTPEEAQEAAD